MNFLPPSSRPQWYSYGKTSTMQKFAGQKSSTEEAEAKEIAKKQAAKKTQETSDSWKKLEAGWKERLQPDPKPADKTYYDKGHRVYGDPNTDMSW